MHTMAQPPATLATAAAKVTEGDMDFSESVQRGEMLLSRFYARDDAASAVQARWRQRRALHPHHRRGMR